jgi:hypothetical protein
MRKIIQGRVYDTEKATLIGTHQAPKRGSASWWEADLYVTPKSRYFFLAGRGGPMSRWRGKAGVVELTKEEACTWIEEHLGKRALHHFDKEGV